MKNVNNALSFLPSMTLLVVLSVLLGLTACDTVDPVVEDVEELALTYEGTYFYQFAALQEAREGLLAVNSALMNQAQGQLTQQELLSLKNSYTRLTEDILASWEYAGRIRCRPPFCPPPNPCDDRPDGIVCDRLILAVGALKDFRLPELWADGRNIEVLDMKGEVVASTQQGGESFVERNLRYQMDIPDGLSEGRLVITENRDGVETLTEVAFRIE